MKVEKNHIVFDDGTREYAYENIIGLSADDIITYGCDGYVGEFRELSLDQKKEICSYMINRYRNLLNKLNDIEQ